MSQAPAPKSAESAYGKRVNRIPLSTYRLQLGSDLTLDQVHELLPYLQRLGVSDLYLSPLFRSRAESSHGYDVVDHGTIDPAIGNLASFEHLAEAARVIGMGIVLDVVPNHMGINDPGNVWWLDVLENGEGSYFADFFDIEWHPPASGLHDKILLPFLAEPFGRTLEQGELTVVYDNGRLKLAYGPRRFPLKPTSWPIVLRLAIDLSNDVGGLDKRSTADWSELQSIITQLCHLPEGTRRDAEAMEDRYREQKIAGRRIEQLLHSSPEVSEAFRRALLQINGEKDNPRSFDTLEQLLEQQWYRLAYWRVASDEINYRRFFDINDLAAICVENPRVFDAVHRLVGHLLERGWITGLRIDHPDGLQDPHSYFKSLQALYRSHPSPHETDASEVYIVAEKILSGDEPLPADWAVCGTTGYDLLNLIGRLQVDADGLAAVREFYDRVTCNHKRPADIVYESRRAVLLGSMASELQMLTAALYRIAQKHRSSRDFTQPALQQALREILASMTVYRTYARNDSWEVSEADYRTVTSAVRLAKRRNRMLPVSASDFISSVLLLEHPPTITDEQAAERRQFALKFQQVSGPVAAKGVEDTAFYRYYPLASLNEVGGELDAKALATDEFHRLMRHRMDSWPHSLSATSTHDSKRGEDLRARLHVLSEAPGEWADAFKRWQKINGPLIREIDGEAAPDANEEYLIYQTLVGIWPIGSPMEEVREKYLDRVQQYIEKALNEAKINTSWRNPSPEYASAVREFIGDLFGDEGREFRAELSQFVERIAGSGFVNSLAQLVLKMTVPGVPDFYQGTELWDFNLVDPDNRRPVDYDTRRCLLDRLWKAANDDPVAAARHFSEGWPDPDIKLWITARCLRLRRELADLFTFGEYIPINAQGPAVEHVISFARRHDRDHVIVVVPKCFYRLMYEKRGQSHFATKTPPGHSGDATRPVPGDSGKSSKSGIPHVQWGNTQAVLPDDFPNHWQCELSGKSIAAQRVGDQQVIQVADLLGVFPVALLKSQTE